MIHRHASMTAAWKPVQSSADDTVSIIQRKRDVGEPIGEVEFVKVIDYGRFGNFGNFGALLSDD